MKLAFVHGWSVHHTDTYGELPEILAAQAAALGLALDPVDIHLGRYISFRNEVRMDDVVRAFDRALRDSLGDGRGGIAPFACITHSTGGPVVREWLMHRYGATGLTGCPLAQLIMLAPANHGSALARLGSERLGRIKAWAEGIQPGEKILEWLALGSTSARSLNERWLPLVPFAGGSSFMPFVLTGQTIDKALYDYINPYTGEAGSDGVVRVAAANLAYSWLTLRQGTTPVTMARETKNRIATLLEYRGDLRRSHAAPLLVVPAAAHSGKKLGIMRSPKLADAPAKPVVGAILEAAQTRDAATYATLAQSWSDRTVQEQTKDTDCGRHFQVIFQITDDQGFTVTDYDVILLAGPGYDPDKLPAGFFGDKQVNKQSPERITFFLNFDTMLKVPGGQFGFRVVARPNQGFAYYAPAEFRSDTRAIDHFVDPNSTLYVDIVLRRLVDQETARFGGIDGAPGEFKNAQPGGQLVD